MNRERPAFGLLASPFVALECENSKSPHYHAEACVALAQDATGRAAQSAEIADVDLTSVLEAVRRGSSPKAAEFILIHEQANCSSLLVAADGWNASTSACYERPLHADALTLNALLHERAQQGLPGAVDGYARWLRARWYVLSEAVGDLKALQAQHPADTQLLQAIHRLEAAKAEAYGNFQDWQHLADL
jgi:hypothetical protein